MLLTVIASMLQCVALVSLQDNDYDYKSSCQVGVRLSGIVFDVFRPDFSFVLWFDLNV